MTTKNKKATHSFFHYLKLILVAAFIVCLVFIANPARYFCYALLISIVISLKSFQNFRVDYKKTVKDFCLKLTLTYFAIITLLSVSPFLTVQEFKASHLNWIAVNPVTIKPSFSWDNGYKRKGNSYADAYYEYNYKGESYENTESKALKKYYPFWERRDVNELISEFSIPVKEKISRKNYIFLISPGKPEKSKLFLSTDLFYFQGSLFYNMVTGMAGFLLIVLGIIGSIFLLSLNGQRGRKQNR
jgi:hypothetical protein